jgi:hypothetical protein
MITQFNEINNITKYMDTLYSFVLDFFTSVTFVNDIKYKIRKEKRICIDFGIENPKKELMVFFTSCVFEKNKINNSPIYIGMLYWKRSLELEEYLNSLMTYEPETAYYIVKDWDDLISNLTMKEYNFREEAKKYNL